MFHDFMCCFFTQSRDRAFLFMFSHRKWKSDQKPCISMFTSLCFRLLLWFMSFKLIVTVKWFMNYILFNSIPMPQKKAKNIQRFTRERQNKKRKATNDKRLRRTYVKYFQIILRKKKTVKTCWYLLLFHK